MTYKTILVLPTGQLRIQDQIVEYEDKFRFIIDNFDNPNIPDTQILIDNNPIGRAIDYKIMDDGLYFTLELNNELEISNKYPYCELTDYINEEGVSYKFHLKSIILCDEPQYTGNQYKELNKELQVPNPNDYNDEQEWMNVCIPAVMQEGVSQEDAKGKCFGIWKNKQGVQNSIQQPEKKSKIDILSSIKKLIEKNGYAISDEKILEMFGVIEEKNLTRLSISKIKKLDSRKNIHEIKVFPKKTVYIEKYDEHINFNDKLFTEMISAFKNPKLFKPYVDEDHQLGEKFADVIDIYTKEDGLYAKIELNEKGKNVIKNNIYSYISPEWGDRTDTDGDTHKNVLWAITLTNIPALEGENPKLQEQIKLSKKTGGKYMTLTQKLANLEGKVSNYKLQEEPMMMPPEIMEAIQMIKDAIAKIDELTMQNQEIVEEKEAALAQKEVAEKLAEKYKGDLDTIEAEKSAKEKENFFETVVKDGQLEASEVEDFKLMYDKNEEIVRKLLTSRNKKNDNGDQKTTTTLDKNNGDLFEYDGKKYKLTNEDYFIMKERKLNRNKPEDVEKYIEATGLEEVK